MGKRLIEESKIICFGNPNKKFMKFLLNYQNSHANVLFWLSRFCKINYCLSTQRKVFELKSFKLYINSLELENISRRSG